MSAEHIEVQFGDITKLKLDRVTVEVKPADIDNTLNILRQQRRVFVDKASAKGAANGDRVTVDLHGAVDGKPFEGGDSTDCQFVVGESRMPRGFDQAVRGARVGDVKTVQMPFPSSYADKAVAGKRAAFAVAVRKVEVPHFPDVEALAQTLAPGGTTEDLRAGVKQKLEREVAVRLDTHHADAAIRALDKIAVLDVPADVVQVEAARLYALSDDSKQEGAGNEPPPERFVLLAERRVRRKLVIAAFAREHALQATPEQVQAHLARLAADHKTRAEFDAWLEAPGRADEVTEAVEEKNVVDFLFSHAAITERQASFASVVTGATK